MADYSEVGEITETLGDVRFEWVISDFLMLPKEVDTCFTSPYFPFSDTLWYLSIYPNGLRKHESRGWIGLYLHRGDSGSPRTIRYTLGIKRADGVEETIFTESLCVHMRGSGWGVPEFLARLTLKRRILELAPLNTLTVTCRLRSEAHHILQGGRFLSRAVQTEISDITSGEENSRREEDSTSLDIKSVTLLSERLKELLIGGDDHDVRIIVKNKEFRAHRNVLRARCPVFAMMFNHDTEENSSGTINIEDCDPDSFGEFLLYVYSGKMENLTPGKALNLYYAAEKYNFPVLKERCVSFLKSSLTRSTICDVILLAAKHEEEELLETAIDFFVLNIEEVLVTVEWQRFMRDNPVEANELYIKGLKRLHPKA